MSLVGASTAIVSVGVSCQTVFQLHHHAQAMSSRLGGEVLVETGMPFDWRIQPPAAITAILRENNPYPPSLAELSRDRHRFWEKRSTWFWHERPEDFAKFSEKQAHLWANWGRIGRTKRQIFIGSNTQANLATKREEVGGIDVATQLEDLFGLLAQLEALFPAPELHFVTRPALLTDLGAFGFKTIREREHVVTVKRLARGGVHLHLLEPDKSSWQGPTEAWAKILDRIVRAKAPSKVTTAK